MANGEGEPWEVDPPPSPRKYWTRKGVAEWLAETLTDETPAIVDIDHGFSFPRTYFDAHHLPYDWPKFLDYFHKHRLTEEDRVRVDDVRKGARGSGANRQDNNRWRRVTEQRAGAAKSVFHFDVQGSVAKSTHSGIPWLRYLREKLGAKIHFWPFDGWNPPPGRHVIAEVYPRLWSKLYEPDDRTGDQHDAYSVCRWMRDTDTANRLPEFLAPNLSADEIAAAKFEGWIPGVNAVTGVAAECDIRERQFSPDGAAVP